MTQPVPLPDPPPALAVRLGLWLHHALLSLANRVLPPHARAMDAAVGAARTYALRAAIRIGLFDELARRPAATSAQLADALGLDPDAAHRFLRALASLGFVRMDRQGRFDNAPVGTACLQGGGVHAFVEYFASASNLEAWAQVEHVLRSGAPSFDQVHGCSVWDWFDAHPHELATFADAMAFLTTSDAAAIATGFPFAAHGPVCDVGGGQGTLAAELLVRHPGLQVTVVDRDAVLPHADRHLVERGVRDRATLLAGDFFNGVPAGHGLYVLKNVLHDWDDQRCVEILSRVRAGCTPQARVLVVEARQEWLGLGPTTLGDLQMMVVTDRGRERSEREYAALFAGAGFQLRRAWPTGSLMVLFEGVLAG